MGPWREWYPCPPWTPPSLLHLTPQLLLRLVLLHLICRHHQTLRLWLSTMREISGKGEGLPASPCPRWGICSAPGLLVGPTSRTAGQTSSFPSHSTKVSSDTENWVSGKSLKHFYRAQDVGRYNGFNLLLESQTFLSCSWILCIFDVIIAFQHLLERLDASNNNWSPLSSWKQIFYWVSSKFTNKTKKTNKKMLKYKAMPKKYKIYKSQKK